MHFCIKFLSVPVLIYCASLLCVLNYSVSATAPPEKTVELAIFVDQHLYNHWVSTVRSSYSWSSIHHFIQSYLDVLLQSLNLIYAHPSLRSSSSSEEAPIIGFHLAHTQLVWRGAEASSRSLRDSAPTYLETFCDFANRENWGGTRWDHALLLTGVDLNFPNGTNYGVAGE